MFNANPYQTYGYQGYGMPNYSQRSYAPQPQQMVQPMPQQPQPQMQYEIPIQDVRFVTSEEAKAYIVMPNSKALLIDKTGTAYLKTADNMGQSTTQFFRFEPINADGSPIKPQEPAPTFNPEEFSKKFVTVEQYNALLEQFNQIKKMIGGKPNGTTVAKQP